MENKNAGNNQTNIPGRVSVPPSDFSKLKGGGSPIPEPLKHSLEAAFGADFSNVRIHTGCNASKLTKTLGAEAFTLGNHIVFGSGTFQPHTDSGRRLLAHELTHVVQQQTGIPPKAGD